MTSAGFSKNSILIPWHTCFRESIQLIRKHPLSFSIFLFAFFLTSFLGQLVDFDWNTVTPLELWYSISLSLSIWCVSYFIFVVLILWIKNQSKNTVPTSFLKILQETTVLLLPLTLLSIRGAFISVFGFLLFIVPGLYFSFKYQLAAVCLILEGWKTGASPLIAAEQLISGYKLKLFWLAALMLTTGLIPWSIEVFVKFTQSEILPGIRIGLALLDASMTASSQIYFAVMILSLLRTLEEVPKK